MIQTWAPLMGVTDSLPDPVIALPSVLMDWSRREFLTSTGTLALSGVLGGHLLGCRPRRDFDLCIIGSGFAGTFLGLETARAGLATVILEAGAESKTGPRRHGTQGNFRFLNDGEIRYPVRASRTIGGGGTSRKWAGILSRFWPADLELHSRYGVGADWPLGYDELAPYYCRAEKALGAKGFAPHTGQPPRECPYPQLIESPYKGPDELLTLEQPEFYPIARSRRNGGPVRLAEEEIPAFVRLPQATFLSDRQVTRLVTLDGQHIHHAETRGGDGQDEVIRARAFVVAAGPIECPRLLLLSTSDWFPTGLGNRSDLVGRFFNVHPSVKFNFERESELPISDAAHRSYTLNEPFRRSGLSGCSVQVAQYSINRFYWTMQPEIEARRTNRIRLSETEVDGFGDPLPVVELSYSERDRKTMAKAEAILAVQVDRLNDSGGRARRSTGFRMHPAGTCRMGFDEASGVVDRDNRVFGLENLFVSGACAFPSSGSANPVLTIVALTFRLADHLKKILL
jgi:choline dehydrogenase-like flavoprotein